MKLSIIIPTRNRSNKIRILLRKLKLNKKFFNEILIIDSSETYFKQKTKKLINNYFKNLNIKYYEAEPSISKQRNIGIKKMSKKNNYYMLIDDDIDFKRGSFKIIQKFIRNNNSYIGYSFNILTKQKYNILDNFKKNFVFKKLGLYNNRPGVVTPSGWQTKISNLSKNLEVNWMPSCASIYKAKEKIYFDEFYDGYSYLEDLDFSYRKSKRGKLIVVKNAICFHNNFIERKNISFGKKELVNSL